MNFNLLYYFFAKQLGYLIHKRRLILLFVVYKLLNGILSQWKLDIPFFIIGR